MQINERTYRQLAKQNAGPNLLAAFPEDVLNLWYDDYKRNYTGADLVTVNLESEGSSFTYLFDLTRQRNVGVAGIPTFVKHKRDANRMAGAPIGAGAGYHRGHLMAHSIGGNADINLIPQLGSLNIGEFRVIERLVRKLALENIDCVYFVRTIYPADGANHSQLTQIPEKIEQGVVLKSGNVQYAIHNNF